MCAFLERWLPDTLFTHRHTCAYRRPAERVSVEGKLVDLLTHNWSSKCQCNRSLLANSGEVAVNGGARKLNSKLRLSIRLCCTHLLEHPLKHDWLASFVSGERHGQLIFQKFSHLFLFFLFPFFLLAQFVFVIWLDDDTRRFNSGIIDYW